MFAPRLVLCNHGLRPVSLGHFSAVVFRNCNRAGCAMIKLVFFLFLDSLPFHLEEDLTHESRADPMPVQ